MHTMTTNPSADLPSLRALADSTHGVSRRNSDGSLEQRAHDRLIAVLGAGEPDRLRACVEVIRELFNADSAGLHIAAAVTPGISHLDVVCGMLDTQESQHSRVGSGLAKLCSSARAPIVLSEQEIELTYLRHLRPRVVHVLTAPIYDGQQFLGAIWLAQVSSAVTYSRADTLVLQHLSHDLSLGLKVLEREREQAALAASLEERCENLQKSLRIEQRRREEAEDAALRAEKARARATTLLKEAHHRVKNTLQVSGSLLSLQAHACTSEATRAALKQATDRLQLVMQVHQLLYDPERDSEQIPAVGLLKLVIASLMRESPVGEQRISLHAISDEVTMSSGECTTLMIIVNELVTNAFKHAFPDDLRGSITVELKSREEAVILRVADTGVGMQAPSEDQHFGLTLVRSLVDQLNGSLVISNAPLSTGTVATLTIPNSRGVTAPSEIVAP